MSVIISVSAVPPGSYRWARDHAPLSSPNRFYYRGFRYRRTRSITDGPPSHLIGGSGVGPNWFSTRKFYEALTGQPPHALWAGPATDRYRRALVGGDRIVSLGDDFGTARFSTPAEAAATVREIAALGGPAATRAELAEWDGIIEKYAYFFERHEPGEELFYYLY